MMYENGMMDGMPMMGGLGLVFMLLFWGFAVFGLICTVRWLLSRGKPDKDEESPQSPLDILKSRYARGELTEENFTRMKRDLE